MSGRRHDFIAVHVQDQREEILPNVGIITLEDAETGEQLEINTADRTTRARFSALAETRRAELNRTLRRQASTRSRCERAKIICRSPLVFQTTRAATGRAMNFLPYAFPSRRRTPRHRASG